MPAIIAKVDLWGTDDETRLVTNGNSPDARFLVARKGRQVPPNWAHLVTSGGNPKKGSTKAIRPEEDK